MNPQLKPQSLEARIEFLREATRLLDKERREMQLIDGAGLEPQDAEAAEANNWRASQEWARHIYREYAPLLRGTPEEGYLDRFVIDYMPHKIMVSDMALEDMGLSESTYNALHNAGVQYAGQIRERGEGGLLKIKDFGRKGLREVTTVFSRLGLPLDKKKYVTPEDRAQALETRLDMSIYDFFDKYEIRGCDPL